MIQRQAPTQEAAKGDAYKWMALLVVSIGTFMSTMDFSIVNISFPTLTRVFDTGPEVVLWVSLSYMLTIAGLMLTLGQVGDMWGRKKVYTLGFILFSLGLALCSFSQSVTQLILFRVIQAIGAAMIVGMQSAIVTAAFPARERGKALGIVAAVVGAGLMSGPALGGFLIDALGWRSIFYLRLPVGIMGVVMAWAILREQVSSHPRPRFDLRGAAALFGGLTTLLVAVNQGQHRGWDSAYILGLFGVSVLMLTFFIINERRVVAPVVDLNLFRRRLFAMANVSLLLRFVASIAVTFLMPFYLIQALGYSCSKAGLLLTVVPLAMLVVSPASGWLSDRMGSRFLCSVGLSLMGLGFFLISGLNLTSSFADISLGLLVVGLGGGLFESPNNSSIMGAVPGERLGTASAMLATLRVIGQATGLAIAGAIFTSRQLFHAAWLAPEYLEPGVLQAKALVGGFHDALVVALLFCSLGIIVSLARGK